MLTRYLQKKRLSLSFKLPLLFFISYIMIALIMVDFLYIGFERRMKEQGERLADGMTGLMASVIEPDKINEYIEGAYATDEYNRIIDYFYFLKDSYPDVKYVYVYKFDKDNPTATVIFDLGEEHILPPPEEDVEWIGDKYQLDEPFTEDLKSLTTENKLITHEVKTKDGEYLLSCVKPVFDENGTYACSVCVDFDLSKIHKRNIWYAVNVAIFLVIAMAVVFGINIYSIRGMIVKPIQDSIDRIRTFKYETEDDRIDNIHKLEALDINTGDEIEEFYKAYLDNMKESIYYMRSYMKASKEAEEMSILAYRDELTGVGNKMEYRRTFNEIENRMADGDYNYGVIVIDVNDLKYVNDTFGHNKGDIYLKGCCKIICDMFKHSPVCRVGGDEFTVFVMNDDYENIHDRLKELKMSFVEACEDTETPWEKYSASVGYAGCGKGKELKDVVVEADKLMYKDKIEFKKRAAGDR